jgi:hypothetical protein
MSDFLETLKNGLQEAHQKFSAAQQKFAATQAEFQQVQQRMNVAQADFQARAQEFQAFQTLVNLETRKRQGTAGAPSVGVIPVTAAIPAIRMPAGVNVASAANRAVVMPAVPNQNIVVPPPPLSTSTSHTAIESNNSEGSQTQAVRDLLRQHPAGMTPVEIWEQVGAKISSRAYLYSVLKRLREKGDAKERRGKYFFISKPEESPAQTIAQ